MAHKARAKTYVVKPRSQLPTRSYRRCSLTAYSSHDSHKENFEHFPWILPETNKLWNLIEKKKNEPNHPDTVKHPYLNQTAAHLLSLKADYCTRTLARTLSAFYHWHDNLSAMPLSFDEVCISDLVQDFSHLPESSRTTLSCCHGHVCLQFELTSDSLKSLFHRRPNPSWGVRLKRGLAI